MLTSILSSPAFLSGFAFLSVFAIFGFLAFVFRDTSPKTATRLDMLIGRRRRDDDDKADILRRSAFEGDKKTFLEMITPKFLSPQKLFEQADCHIKPSTLFGVGVLLAVVAATLGIVLRLSVYFIPFLALVFFSVPFLWLINKRRVRLKKFAAQLSDALELVARALRAGHSLGAGMHVVAEEMPAPICEEFGRVFEETNLGIPIEDAMKSMCDRVPNLDLRFFVTSVAIQRQTGGDLAEILDKIGYVIRERFRILGQVQALTGEGRLSGIVLIALPFALFLFMLNVKPDYISALWTTELGRKMSIFAIIAQILGALMIRKIVNIKV
jgi:tight adherence protein B